MMRSSRSLCGHVLSLNVLSPLLASSAPIGLGPYFEYGYSIGSQDFGVDLDLNNMFGFGVVRDRNMRLWLGPSVRLSADIISGTPSGLPALGARLRGVLRLLNKYEKLDETVKESLEIALRNGNVFGDDASRPYRIDTYISIASQATMSFGNFNGKLEIVYKLFDEANEMILEETVYTEAGSDKYYFSGAARHRRARAVNISKNVMQFVQILQGHQEQSRARGQSMLAAAGPGLR